MFKIDDLAEAISLAHTNGTPIIRLSFNKKIAEATASRTVDDTATASPAAPVPRGLFADYQLELAAVAMAALGTVALAMTRKQ